MTVRRYLLALLFVCAPIAVANADGRLPIIKQSGILRCGVLDNVPEMSELIDGKYVGYDVEFCKDLAKRLSVTAEIVPVQKDNPYRSLLFEQKIDLVMGHTSPDDAKDKGVLVSIPYFAFGPDDIRVSISPPSDRALGAYLNEFIWDQILSGRQAKLHNDFTGTVPPNLKDRTCGYSRCEWLRQ